MWTKSFWIVSALCVVLSAAVLTPAPAHGQDRAAPGKMSENFTFIPKADLEVLMGPTRGDRAARVVDIGRGAQLGAYILHYERMKNEPNSFYHSEINELYYVIRGAGTALLGGELENPTESDPNSMGYRTVTGPTVRGAMTGYTTQPWEAGDLIIVPAGVPHMIGWEVTEPNDILRVVVDPNGRLDRVTNRAESLAQDRARQEASGQAQASAPPPRSAPGNLPGTFTFIPKADLEALMTGNIADTPARVVPAGNDGGNVAAFVLHMEPREIRPGPTSSFYHAEIAELYYVVRGSGTAKLGGELENATWDDSNSRSIRTVRGPSVNGTMSDDAQLQPFEAGDILIVTPGVPHSVTYEVTERTDIVRIVVDPGSHLELK